MRADALILGTSGVGIIDSRIVFVPRGLAVTKQTAAAPSKTTMLCIFQVRGL